MGCLTSRAVEAAMAGAKWINPAKHQNDAIEMDEE